MFTLQTLEKNPFLAFCGFRKLPPLFGSWFFPAASSFCFPHHTAFSDSDPSNSLFFFFFLSYLFFFFFICGGFFPYIEMKQPWVYMCSPSRSPLPPPSPPAPSGSSQCTRSEHLSHASNLGW